jgi:hypothetical protein
MPAQDAEHIAGVFEVATHRHAAKYRLIGQAHRRVANELMLAAGILDGLDSNITSAGKGQCAMSGLLWLLRAIASNHDRRCACARAAFVRAARPCAPAQKLAARYVLQILLFDANAHAGDSGKIWIDVSAAKCRLPACAIQCAVQRVMCKCKDARARNILRLQKNVISFMQLSSFYHAHCMLEMIARGKERRATHNSRNRFNGVKNNKGICFPKTSVVDLRWVHRGSAMSPPSWDALPIHEHHFL